MIHYYIVWTLIIIITIRFFYIHIKYPFWSYMSVYHTYDYHHLLWGGNRKIQMFPCKNKYTNPIQVKTVNFYDLNDQYTKYFVELLQCFYIPDDSILYTLVEKDMKSLFSGHFAPSYISFYNEKNLVPTSTRAEKSHKLVDSLSTSIEIGLFPEPKGCIGSFPVRVFSKNESMSANYFTFISTDRSYAEKHISRDLISTHDFNCRKQNPDIHAGILKKDVGTCEGVVPLVEFTTFVVQLRKQPKRRSARNIVQVYRQNWDIMFDTMYAVFEPNALFDLVVSIDVGAIKARIDGGIWFVYAFCDKGNVLAMYFIENAHMLYEKTSAKTLRLVASINNGLTDELFQQGFAECLRKLIKQNLDYKILLVDNVGHNAQIMKNKGEILAETAGAYYFINWLFFNRVERERAFILT